MSATDEYDDLTVTVRVPRSVTAYRSLIRLYRGEIRTTMVAWTAAALWAIPGHQNTALRWFGFGFCLGTVVVTGIRYVASKPPEGLR